LTAETGDGWHAGESYEDFMGRWSRPLSDRFVEWLAVSPGGHWLDVGTGTGALAEAICRFAWPGSLVACDPSVSFVEAARSRVADERVSFAVAGIDDLPAREGGYDAVVSGLALNFFPDPAGAVREQLAAARRGGGVGALVWDYSDGMEFLRHFWNAAIAVDPKAAGADEARRFPICSPGSLKSLFESSGAGDVRLEPIVIPTVFTSFDDYWRPFLGNAGPAPSFVSSLTEETRAALAKAPRGRLPVGAGGAIELRARAWAVAGSRTQ